MSIYEHIKKKVNLWHSQHPEHIEDFVGNTIEVSNSETVQKLNDFVEYLDIYCLKDRLIKAYIDAKYHLKEKAIENPDALHSEDAFYDWLKISINPQKEVNYDFYFEQNDLNKEDEVKKILFDKNGKLRKIFKNPDWRIRLKTIADWFLRRYDGKTARKILSSFDCWNRLKLFYPRMIVAIIVGLFAIMTGEEIWNLPHKLFPDDMGLWGLLSVFSLSIGLVAITVLYLTYECYNTITDKKQSSRRALNVGLKGYLISFLLSFMSCVVMGRISVDPSVVPQYYSVLAGDITLRSILPVFKNTFFFSSAALFIGIFIQVFWEKETITEPL